MEFNVEKTTNEIISFIKEYYQKNNLKGVVIGISGGKDSAVVASLFTKALGSENVLGLWLPCHSKEEDKKDALLLANYLGITLKEVDLTEIYDNFVNNIKSNNQIIDSDLIDANINIKPRLRMTTLYYYAAMMSKINNATYLVAGTSNKCKMYVGYFTKGGDNVCDIRLLADLTVDEVIKIGDYLGVPYHICHKVPDDGLSNQTDEEKLGVKYREIADYINGQEDNLSEEKKLKIKKLHERNLHKFNIPTYYK